MASLLVLLPDNQQGDRGEREKSDLGRVKEFCIHKGSPFWFYAALGDVFPDVLKGMYIAEEAQDIPAEVAEEVKPEPVKEKLPTPEQLEVIQQLAHEVGLSGVEFQQWLRDSYGTSWSRLNFTSANAVIDGLHQLKEAIA